MVKAVPMISARFILGSLLAVLPGAVQAASLRVSPMGVELLADQRAASITVANSDAEPVEMQVRIFQWTQVNGEDRLAPATDVFASPPAMKIAPNKSFTIRIARPTIGNVGGEKAYRLFLDEVPRPFDPRTASQAVRMVLRMSMPVFLVESDAVAKVQWQVWEDGTGIHAEATNSGNRHAKVGGLHLILADGKQVTISQGLAGYVLAGSTKRFDYQPGPSDPIAHIVDNSAVQVVAKNDSLDIHETVIARRR